MRPRDFLIVRGVPAKLGARFDDHTPARGDRLRRLCYPRAKAFGAVMTRAAAITAAEAYFDEGRFTADLARRVAIPTESQVEERAPALHAYLADEIAPSLARLGFDSEIVPNPVRGGPMLLAERREEGARATVFGYGHGDVIRGLEPQWHEGLSPWTLTPRGERLYGRGTADNKGQHTINLAAMECVLKTRGHLGFNAKFLVETGEEIGSPGLRE